MVSLKEQADPDSIGKIFREHLIKAILEDMKFQMYGEDGPGTTEKKSNASNKDKDEDVLSDSSPMNMDFSAVRQTNQRRTTLQNKVKGIKLELNTDDLPGQPELDKRVNNAEENK